MAWFGARTGRVAQLLFGETPVDSNNAISPMFTLHHHTHYLAVAGKKREQIKAPSWRLGQTTMLVTYLLLPLAAARPKRGPFPGSKNQRCRSFACVPADGAALPGFGYADMHLRLEPRTSLRGACSLKIRHSHACGPGAGTQRRDAAADAAAGAHRVLDCAQRAARRAPPAQPPLARAVRRIRSCRDVSTHPNFAGAMPRRGLILCLHRSPRCYLFTHAT